MEHTSPETIHASKRTDIFTVAIGCVAMSMPMLLGAEWGWPFLVAGAGLILIYALMWRTANPAWLNKALLVVLVTFIVSGGMIIWWRLSRPVPILAARPNPPMVPSDQQLTDAFARVWFEYERLHPVARSAGIVVSSQNGAAVGSVSSIGQQGGVTAATINSAPGGIANSGNGPNTGSINQGPCSVAQVGGAGNQATTNCNPVPFRTINQNQSEGIRNALAALPASVKATIGAVYGSGDAANYALLLFPLFSGRHLDNETTPTIRTGIPTAFTNIFVAVSSEDDSAAMYRNILVKALVALGIPAQGANGSRVAPGNLEILVGFRPEEVKPQ